MHNVVLVLGEDPVGRLERLAPDDFDWFVVGGRYGGQLAPRPGGVTRGPDGRTQLQVGDLDLEATLRALAPTPDENIVIGVVADDRWHQGPLLDRQQGAAPGWHGRLRQLLEAAPPEELLTIVDVHW